MKVEFILTCSTTLFRKSSHRFLPSSVACSNTPVADEPVLSSDSQTSLIWDQRISSAVVKHFNRSLKDKSYIALYKVFLYFSLHKDQEVQWPNGQCLYIQIKWPGSMGFWARLSILLVLLSTQVQMGTFLLMFCEGPLDFTRSVILILRQHQKFLRPKLFLVQPLHNIGRIMQTTGLHLKDNQIMVLIYLQRGISSKVFSSPTR